MSIRTHRRLGATITAPGKMVPNYAAGSPQALQLNCPPSCDGQQPGPCCSFIYSNPLDAAAAALSAMALAAPAAQPAPIQPTITTANISPISTAQSPAPSNYAYTADEEMVQQLLYQYGDTWDNAQAIVNAMYAAGITPGTVSQANALPYLTGIGTAATPTTSSLTGTLSAIPTWAWGAAGLGALFLFGKK